MVDWIAEVSRIESDLVAEGVPASDAMRVSAMFADALAKADAAKRKAWRERQAAELLPLGPDVAACRMGVCRRTVYNLASRARKKVQVTA